MSKRTTKYLIVAGLLIAVGMLLVACQGATQVAAPTQGPAPTQAAVPTCPAPAPCPTAAPVVEEGVVAPFEAEWAASPHNALETEAFAHWNEEDPAEVPANCATCHSTPGYIDFLGGDGTEAGKTDNNVPVGTTVTCDACHSDAATALTAVTFPSGAVVDGLGPEARCMVCHQGRASSTQVNAQIERFQAEDPDRAPLPIQDGERTVNFGFINIHYYAAAATLYGTETKGAYEYTGKTYDAKFDHIPGYDTCVDCHNPHTTEIKVEECAVCHEGVASVDDLKAVRMVSSASDYDGDGNVEEGMADEIAGLSDTLYGAIIMYAKDLQGTGIVYDETAHPYWFNDRDNNGEADKNDEGANQAYNTWTPRLLKAAYNYQVAHKDPGNFAHGNKYTVQYLYDSIEDLNVALPTKIDMTAMVRDDAGHFAGNSEAFRHWDAEGEVPASCAKCHSATGLPMFVENGGTHAITGSGSLLTTGVVNVEPSNGFTCYTCHNHNEFPAVYQINEVVFPSGARVSFGEGDPNNLCLQCHQGRESGVSMNRALQGKAANTVDESIRFRNVHYFAAGATLFGSEVNGIYQYEGKEYSGRFMHVENFDSCSECHDAHALKIQEETCAGCHQGQTLDTIRMATGDVDGDAVAEEGVRGEVSTFIEKLYAAIQAYATENSVGIVYDAHAYPYWFADANGDGKADTGENGAVGYAAWTPELVKAAYNYQYAQKDPGAFAHNASYVLQALYDSIEDLGGDLTGLTRPAVTAPAQ